MINLFDLTTTLAGAQLAGKSKRDGSPVRRRVTDLAEVQVDERLGACGNSSSACCISNAVLREMSSVKDIAKGDQMRKGPSVVARLMGLDTALPSEQRGLSSARGCIEEQTATVCRINEQEGAIHKSLQSSIHHARSANIANYKGSCEDSRREFDSVQFRNPASEKGSSFASKSDRKLMAVQEKLNEAKHMAADEKLHYSKEFLEALDVLCSNKDMFLKFLEEPNSILPKDEIPMPQPKRITVLKPVKTGDGRIVGPARRLEPPSNQSWTDKPSCSKQQTSGQPTRIILLKPTPGKSDHGNVRPFPRRIAPEVANHIASQRRNIYSSESQSSFDRLLESMDSFRLQDESMLSSVYNGYGADDSSLNTSDDDSSDEGRPSPVPHCSWDYVEKYNSEFPDSALRASSSHDSSSVIREAKQRLSERWATVTDNKIFEGKIQSYRRSNTLGEMLAFHEVAMDRGAEAFAGRRSMSAESVSSVNADCSARTLPRSRSVPANFSAHEDSEQQNLSNDLDDSNKTKSFLGTKLPGFFFSRSRRTGKRTLSSPTIDGISSSASASEHFNAETTIKDMTSSRSTDAIEDILLPASTSNFTENLDSQRQKQVPLIHHNPSPKSVLRDSFDDSGISEPSSSESFDSGNISIRSGVLPFSWTTTQLAAFPLEQDELPSTSAGMNSDELERYLFVQKLVSSSGMDRQSPSMLFSGWYTPDCPLNPAMLDSLLDWNEEGRASRVKRSTMKLLFDCVNTALIAVSENVLLSVRLWGRLHPEKKVDCWSRALVAYVWLIVNGLFARKEWMCPSTEAGNAVEGAVRRGLEGQHQWMRCMLGEAEEITKEIGSAVLETLVGEALDDFAT